IDARRLVEEGDPTLNVALRAGDIVMVPPARELRVYVTGAVRSPGPVGYSSSDGITVLQAITAAGGPTERANRKNVHVIRNQEDGSQERIEVNLKRIQAGKDDDLILERNDTVVVGEWFL
ncbi:MAG TPA: SLBB domain-containing protein, partial [Gemmatimonadota bacterium]|nr:SLBB domain-containing protein [Gemmatimonadota bacterium]